MSQPSAAILPSSRRPSVWMRLLRHPMGAFSLAVLLLIILASALADVLAPFPPGLAQLNMMNAAPNGDYLLGGDGSGRDILSRLLYAGRLTLAGALITTGILALIGISIGLWAGYLDGIADVLLSCISEVVNVLDSIFVLVAM